MAGVVLTMAKILLVDDDPAVRASLADMLSERGYDVAEATDGNDGLRALGREAFDLVVLDILMPGREGIETIREIRKKWAALPVLAISGAARMAGAISSRWPRILAPATRWPSRFWTTNSRTARLRSSNAPRPRRPI